MCRPGRVVWSFASCPDFEPYRINLIQQNADMFDRFLRAYGPQLLNGAFNIGYWLWELPSVRSDWHHVYQFVDEVWAPSEFGCQALRALTDARCQARTAGGGRPGREGDFRPRPFPISERRIRLLLCLRRLQLPGPQESVLR